MEETPSLNMTAQRLKVAILPWDLTCSGLITHSGEILTTGKSHGRNPDRFPFNDGMVAEKVSRFTYSTCTFNKKKHTFLSTKKCINLLGKQEDTNQLLIIL